MADSPTIIDISQDGPDLKVSEAARVLRVSPHTVYAWIDHGLLDGYKYPSAQGEQPIIRISRAALRAFKVIPLTPAGAARRHGTTAP